jgi:Ca2+-transporting ATPase
MKTWHTLTAEETVRTLGVDPARGLEDDEVERRRAEYGPNTLVESRTRGPWRILWEQFTAVMVLILLAAATVSALIGSLKDTGVILAIVVLFAVLGFVQEYRAERAMAALQRLAVPRVRIRRARGLRDASARDLVPGDILVLEEGTIVPADCRLLEGASLRVQEATLTGESASVEKTAGALDAADLPLGDRRNMVYMGTVVTYGRGVAAVVETGMQTELGRIASMLEGVEHEMTPLQTRLDQLGKALGAVAVAVAILIFALGLLRGEALGLMVMTAIGVAVAAVPEGLPAVVTITLALGAQRMLRRNAIIRTLPAVETLGSVTVICSDKTGTLTENRMTVVTLEVPGVRVHLAANGSDTPAGGAEASMELLLAGAALCNNAVLEPDGTPGGMQIVGDPTEGALLRAAARFGLWKDRVDTTLPRIAELPFDSERKRMMTVHQLAPSSGIIPTELEALATGPVPAHPARHALAALEQECCIGFAKGAVDALLEVASHVWVDGRQEPLTAARRASIAAADDELAEGGMRVLGVAFRLVGQSMLDGDLEGLERDLTFIGMAGMIDPPRAGVREAVATCRAAGIRPVMITGDHPLTARAIARELQIASGERVVTGRELGRLTDAELREVVGEVSVYARVSPEHKLKIVEALQAGGNVVAMTGDGVNDAPALKRADIGVAMGLTGTDVSKEAADMVLRDDNFATIVSAVEEGRVIYDNIRKFVEFSVSGNVGKILVMLVAPLMMGALPLLPLQLLWLNLLTDGLLGLGLGVENAERDVMRRRPYAPGQSIFAGGTGRHIVWVGALIGLVSIGVGYWHWLDDHARWQTMLFTTLAFAQVGQAFAIRSNRDSVFRIGILSNKLLAGMVALVVALQLGVIYLGPLHRLFGTEALSVGDLLATVALGALVFAVMECEKWWLRREAVASGVVPEAAGFEERRASQGP